MEVVRINYKHIDTLPSSVACIGYFDGFHLGHQALMQQTVQLAQEQNVASAIITFDPDPWCIFYPDRQVQHLTTLEDRIQIAKSMHIDIFYVLTFSKEFASQDVDAFHELLHKMKIRWLVCGFDFQYASKNQGDVHTLKKQDYFKVFVVDSINQDESKISSSRIEPLVMSGDVWQANQLLSYVYSIQGHVVNGFKRGTNLLKIPTANLHVDSEYILPAVGVYSGMVSVDDTMYAAMINIGNNPTFDNETQTIEAHILDFNQDIYGKEVRFYFLRMIRAEEKFENFQALVAQLHRDIDTSREDIHTHMNYVMHTAQIWEKNFFIEK